jgi:hypothetical protein
MHFNKKTILSFLLIISIPSVYGQPSFTRAGLVNRLIEIKYSTELYLIINGKLENKKDTALAVYNLMRWKVDGLVYQIAADMITANSNKALKQLNSWCTLQPEVLMLNTAASKNKRIQQYMLQLNDIDAHYRKYVITLADSNRSLNLTTNVFYLIKDSWSVVKGLSDMKTQKTMALVELLDQTRLSNPIDLLKLK